MKFRGAFYLLALVAAFASPVLAGKYTDDQCFARGQMYKDIASMRDAGASPSTNQQLVLRHYQISKEEAQKIIHAVYASAMTPEEISAAVMQDCEKQ
jgi:hypothetical protein